MIVTLAGHVDHGKTALVRALTGVNTDRLREEQERGLTIDLGFAYTNIGDEQVGFVDVPGHHRFIHNMIAGVAEQQHALLVVAVDDGVMPQTREHLQILKLLGLRHGTVALNKVDKVPQVRVDEVRKNVRDELAGTFLHDADIVATSAERGIGVDAIRDSIRDAARTSRLAARNRSFRFAIDRAFSLHGIGTVVTGTVVSGGISTDDRVVLSSSGELVRVRSIDVSNRAAKFASTGARCGINLAAIDVDSVSRGDWLESEETFLPILRPLVQLEVLDDFPRSVRHRAPVHVYHHTSHAQGRVLFAGQNSVAAGTTAYGAIDLASPLQLKIGDRLILRDHDLRSTLGGGTVLGSAPRSANSKLHLELLERLSPCLVDDAIHNYLDIVTDDVPVDCINIRRNWSIPALSWRQHQEASNVVVRQNMALSDRRVRAIGEQLTSVISGFHNRNPSLEGVPLSNVISLSKLPPQSVQFVLAHDLLETVELRNGLYALSSFERTLEEFDEDLYRKLKELIDTKQPASTGDIAKRLSIPLTVVTEELSKMATAEKFVKVVENRYFTPQHLDALMQIALSLAKQGPFTVRQFRDASGLGRNVAINVLEYFDHRRFTVRSADARVVRDSNNSSILNH